MSIAVRSIAFNVLFYLNTAIWLVIALPTFFMPYRGILAVAKAWGRCNLVLLRVVAGIDYEIRGREKIPPGALIVAAKHQSAWETFALMPLFDNPLFIVKRELQWIPDFRLADDQGPHGAGRPQRRLAGALTAMTERARIELARGRQLIIFPEGTRRPAGAEPRYKFGVARLYAARACLACRSRSIRDCSGRAARSCGCRGRCWWRFSIRSRPGSTSDVFFERLQDTIESATARLIAEAKSKAAS